MTRRNRVRILGKITVGDDFAIHAEPLVFFNEIHQSNAIEIESESGGNDCVGYGRLCLVLAVGSDERSNLLPTSLRRA